MESFPATLSYVSFVIGILSLVLTALNLLALYSNLITTLRAAPHQVPDVLGSLREQLLEEREALRQQARELRQKRSLLRESRRAPHPAHAGRPRSSSRTRGAGGGLGSAHSSSNNLRGHYALTHSEQTLGLHYAALRDLWRRFRVLERPFLKVAAADTVTAASSPSLRTEDAAAAGIIMNNNNNNSADRRGATAAWGEDDMVVVVDEKALPAREDVEMQAGEAGGAGAAAAATLYRCDFVQRFVWWQTKEEVLKVADAAQKIALRRMAREVTCCRMMLRQIRDGGEGPEDIASPVLDGPGGGVMATGSSRTDNYGPTPLGMRRRPVGETSNVYESSEESDSSAIAAKMKHRPEERDARIRVSEARRWPISPGWDPPSRGDGYGPRYASDGWRPGQYPRIDELPFTRHPPIILEAPRAPRARSRHGLGHDGHYAPHDGRR